MEISKKTQTILIIIGAILLIAIGFFIGRKTIEGENGGTHYSRRDTIYIDKPYPKPVETIIDTADVIKDCIASGKYYELFPEKVRDSIVYITAQDTADIIRDWAAIRKYNETIVDCDTIGTAKINATVQYNRLTNLSGTFVPVVKETIVYKTKKYEPFVSGGIMTNPSIKAGAGMFFNGKYGFEIDYQYLWADKKSAVGLSAVFKF